MKPFLYLAALAFLACSAHADTAGSDPAACPEGQAVSLEEIAATHKAILYGEYHGTNEMPAAFADQVVALARKGRRIVVALEYPRRLQGDLDAVMAAPDEVKALDAFAMHHTNDGRTSDAMRNMLLSLRALKLAGADIQVIAADSDAQPSEADAARAAAFDLPARVDRKLGQRDLDLAMNAREACEATGCDLILLYAGNVHTRLEIMQSSMMNMISGEQTPFWTAPAGYVLSRFMPTASVYLAHRGGSATNRTEQGIGLRKISPALPDFAMEDGLYYCASPDWPVSHVLSVGEISSSADTLAPLPDMEPAPFR